MGSRSGPNIVKDGLILYLDAGNKTSYPESGTAWADLSPGGNNSTLTGGPTRSYDNIGAGAISGGTVTTDGEYIIHTFTNDSASENFITNVALQADVLIVAGGGGGGMDMGGGGGAGGLIYTRALSISSGTHAVVVGSGGAGGPAGNTTGQGTAHQFQISATNGENTTAFSYTAIGGGYGASSYYSYSPNNGTPNSGGSGGGTSGYSSGGTIAGAAGTAGQGNAGGQGGGQYYSGGGGGAGAVGVSSTAVPHGGIGRQINIDGNNYYWAGGGGGAAYSVSPGGNGGSGGGGGGAVGTTTGGSGINAGSAGGGGSAASQTNTPGGDAGANTGGGGGGGSHYNYTNAGGDGGSGIVIIRYHKSYAPRNFHLSFDGIDNYVNMGDVDSFDFSLSDFTISCWLYLDILKNWQVLFTKQPATRSGGWHIVINNAGSVVFDANSWAGTITCSPVFSAGSWQHFTWVRNYGDFIKIYKNSALVANFTTLAGVDRDCSNSQDARIGFTGLPYTGYFDGNISAYMIYSKALSATEISQNYDTQKGRFGL